MGPVRGGVLWGLAGGLALHGNTQIHKHTNTLTIRPSHYIHVSFDSSFIYVYMYICIHVYMYTCIHVYMYICIYVYMCICIYMYICIYAYMYICICVYMYICTHVYMYSCMCVFCIYASMYINCRAQNCPTVRICTQPPVGSCICPRPAQPISGTGPFLHVPICLQIGTCRTSARGMLPMLRFEI